MSWNASPCTYFLATDSLTLPTSLLHLLIKLILFFPSGHDVIMETTYWLSSLFCFVVFLDLQNMLFITYLIHIYLVQVAVAVLVSWMIFRNPISGLNGVGCAITLVGCTFYGYIRHIISQQPPGTPRTPRTPRNRVELLPLVNDKLDDKV